MDILRFREDVPGNHRSDNDNYQDHSDFYSHGDRPGNQSVPDVLVPGITGMAVERTRQDKRTDTFFDNFFMETPP